ncbi:MAG TPA: ABC transporter permease [Dermatophilaceae bacterium]|nr:ABC transporter permease [Dermatophilaceae bacterium]
MVTYLVRRVLLAISVVAATIVAAFTLFFVAPSDPAGAICGQTRCSVERYNDIRASLHLDRPVAEQFAEYALGIVKGRVFDDGGVVKDCPAPCLGYSYITGQPVTELLKNAFPITLTVVVGAAVIFFTFGVTMGSMAARRRGTSADRLLVGATLVMSSIPYYLIALLIFLYFVLTFPVLPRPGYFPVGENGVGKWFIGFLVPWLVLGIYNSTSYARYARGSMVEALSEDYVRTARSKGISEARVTYVHGLRAAITPVVTIFGLDVGGQLAGAIFTERIFDLPGMGRLVLESFVQSDLPVIMGTVIVGAVALVIANLTVDIVYSFLDPRVKLA